MRGGVTIVDARNSLTSPPQAGRRETEFRQARAGRPRIVDFHTNIHELTSRRHRNVPYYTRDNMEGQRSHANIATSAISKNPTSESLIFIRSAGAEAFPRDHIPERCKC